jgi:ATP-dependent Clp protease adaptor protein ClpS
MMANSTPDGAAEQSMWSVLLLNDDTTPMEFVVYIIERFFEADHDSAKRKMLGAHNEGSVECGVYPYEEAKTKALQVTNFARKHQHTLQCCVIERKP